MARLREVMVLWVAIVAMLCSSLASAATPVDSVKEKACPDFNVIDQLKKVCWDCYFPFMIFGQVLGSKKKVPDDYTKSPFCTCKNGTHFFTLGWWQVTHTIETVRQPFCMPSLGGIIVTDDDIKAGDLPYDVSADGAAEQLLPGRWGGPGKDSANPDSNAYYNFHLIKFPMAYLIGALADYVCSKKTSGGIDIAFMSEFDPSWNNDELALWVSPETKLFTGAWSQLACAYDGIVSTVKKPDKRLYWCAGTLGQITPYSGNIPVVSSHPREAHLNAVKGLSKMHRFGLVGKNYGKKNLCKIKRTFILEKQQWKFQTVFPSAEKKNHWIGASPFRWGEWRTRPMTGEDFVWLVYGYTECCGKIFWK